MGTLSSASTPPAELRDTLEGLHAWIRERLPVGISPMDLKFISGHWHGLIPEHDPVTCRDAAEIYMRILVHIPPAEPANRLKLLYLFSRAIGRAAAQNAIVFYRQPAFIRGEVSR